MPKSVFENNPAFSSMGDDARKAVSQAFDSMSDWRKELASLSERNSNMVFDKMAEAAKSLGWPTDFVELSRRQMMSASQIQIQAIDQVMSVWEKQLSSFGSLPEMPKFPGMPTGGSIPGMPDMASPMAPLQIWMQAAEMWQKNWQQAMNTWMDAQSKMTKGGKF